MRVNAGSNFNTDEATSYGFNGSATGGTAPYTYSWNFGDGTTGSAATPTHTYADSGSYTAALTVNDSAGHTASDSVVATVANLAPTAAIGTPCDGIAGDDLSFTASAADPSPADMAAGFTYNWDFGDGTTGTGASPSHCYAAAGTYTVGVKATDMAGDVSTPANSVITVAPAAPSALSAGAGSNFSTNEGTSHAFSGTASAGRPLHVFLDVRRRRDRHRRQPRAYLCRRATLLHRDPDGQRLGRANRDRLRRRHRGQRRTHRLGERAYHRVRGHVADLQGQCHRPELHRHRRRIHLQMDLRRRHHGLGRQHQPHLHDGGNLHAQRHVHRQGRRHQHGRQGLRDRLAGRDDGQRGDRLLGQRGKLPGLRGHRVGRDRAYTYAWDFGEGTPPAASSSPRTPTPTARTPTP